MASKDRTLYGFFAIFGGMFGLQYFYIEEKTKGIVSLVLSLLCVFAPIVMLVSFIDGISKLCMTDEEFQRLFKREPVTNERGDRMTDEEFQRLFNSDTSLVVSKPIENEPVKNEGAKMP